MSTISTIRLLIVLFCSMSVVHGENLIYNSSFECKGAGWHTWGNSGGNIPQGNTAPLNAHVVSTNGVARHGANAFFFWTILWSRPLWLLAGTYTHTFSARAVSSETMSFGLQRTYLINYNTAPTNSIALTTAWKRFTNVVVIETNGWHNLTFKHATNATLTWIDSIQLETGAVASAFAPRTLEFGIDSSDYYNNLFLGDTKEARFNIWNEGPQTNITITYHDVHGIWNTNIARGTITTNALAAGTNTTINLTLPTLWGPHRIYGFITNINASWDETGITMLPYAAQSGRDTNGMLGIHPAYEHLGHNRRIGFTWGRFFSPAVWSRWASQFPTLATTNMNPPGVWLSDYMYQAAKTNGIIPYVTLAPDDNKWHPETNASLDVMIGDYTNYVGRMVHRYKDSAYNVHHWEIFNEPQQDPRPAVTTTNPAVYANIFTNAARLIKVIDPDAFVIAFGGYSVAAHGTDAWNAIPAPFQADADAVAFHFYPKHGGLDDPNTTEDWRPDSSKNYTDLWNAFGTVKPIWNTETANFDIGGYHTIAVAYWYPYYFSEGSSWTSEAWFNELEVRALPSVDRVVYNFCRTVGHGIKQYNLQYSRAPDETMFVTHTPTIYELNGSLKPWAAALVIANHFVKTPGLGPVTNISSYFIEAYLHTNILGVVVPIWRMDRGSSTLQFDNGSVALYDTVGNLIQTNSTNIVITRSPRYLVSGTLSLLQLSNTIYSAAGVTNEDTTPPGLTIDMSPIGEGVVWGGATNVFKATAIDERVMSYASAAIQTGTQTNVQYRWTFNDGSVWSPWGATNHFYHSFASSDMYRVGWQAKDQANNVTATAYTPYFGALEALVTPTVINVSGTANIGTINVP